MEPEIQFLLKFASFQFPFPQGLGKWGAPLLDEEVAAVVDGSMALPGKGSKGELCQKNLTHSYVFLRGLLVF